MKQSKEIACIVRRECMHQQYVHIVKEAVFIQVVIQAISAKPVSLEKL